MISVSEILSSVEVTGRKTCEVRGDSYCISPSACSPVLFHLYNSTAPPAVVTIRK